jgi:hypothetical protein
MHDGVKMKNVLESEEQLDALNGNHARRKR